MTQTCLPSHCIQTFLCAQTKFPNDKHVKTLFSCSHLPQIRGGHKILDHFSSIGLAGLLRARWGQSGILARAIRAKGLRTTQRTRNYHTALCQHIALGSGIIHGILNSLQLPWKCRRCRTSYPLPISDVDICIWTYL